MKNLTLDPHDPRVAAARDAEEQLNTFYDLEPREHVVTLPGSGLRVRVTEVGEGPPLLVVPGNTGDGFPFATLLPHLAGYRIVIVQRPGGGLSEGMDHREVDMREFAVETLTAVLDDLGLERVPVLAHSMGGEWSLWLALDRPERVSGLALVGVPRNVLDTCPPLSLRLTSIRGLGTLILRAVSPRSAKTALNGLKVTGHSPESIARQPEALAACYLAFGRLPHYEVSTVSLMQVMNRLRGAVPRFRLTEADLRRITQPVLMVWGTSDPFGSVATAQRIAAILPDAQLQTIDGAGHLPWLDEPARCGELVSGFLAALGTRHHPGTTDERRPEGWPAPHQPAVPAARRGGGWCRGGGGDRWCVGRDGVATTPGGDDAVDGERLRARLRVHHAGHDGWTGAPPGPRPTGEPPARRRARHPHRRG